MHQKELEFSTLIIGLDDEGIFKTKQNGGSKGAYSRQESDGRWSQMAEGLEKLSLVEAVREIGNAKECTFSEAIDIIAEASTQDRDDIIRKIADDLEDKEREEIEA